MKQDDRKLLGRLGFGQWNAMQEEAGKVIPREKEVLLLAPTGSGKTVAFLRPVLQLMKPDAGPQCLVIAPSRELALQTEQVWRQMATGFKVNTIYGGHSMRSEIQSLTEPASLLIGTPGRILDHLNRGTIDPGTIHTLILDEFDKSLALGFEEEMSEVMRALPHLQRKVFVSATNSIELPEFTAVSKLVTLDFTNAPEEETRLELKLVRSLEKDKLHTLHQLLCNLGEASAIIFCNHREAVERTSNFLTKQGIENAGFHGGFEQLEREQTLIRFRNGSVHFLVATDLAGRGLDIPQVQHVIHYHLPLTAEEFRHRNGRTARMFSRGSAWLILHGEEELPSYLTEEPVRTELKEGVIPPARPSWVTIYINGGRKDKLNKVDIVGAFSQAGKLKKEELGLIEVKDHVSFVAVKRNRSGDLLKRFEQEKIKGKRYKLGVVR